MDCLNFSASAPSAGAAKPTQHARKLTTISLPISNIFSVGARPKRILRRIKAAVVRNLSSPVGFQDQGHSATPRSGRLTISAFTSLTPGICLILDTTVCSESQLGTEPETAILPADALISSRIRGMSADIANTAFTWDARAKSSNACFEAGFI